MELSQHDSRDRIKVARLTGVAERHAHKRDALDMDTAVAELRAISTDIHLLSHAATSYTDPEAWWPAAATILEAAGADLAEARAIWAHHLSLPGARSLPGDRHR